MSWLIVAAIVAIIVAALGYFVFQLGYMFVGGLWATHRAGLLAQEQLAAELSAMSTDALRARLLEDPCLVTDLRHDSGVQAFLSRIASGDEVALAREYPRPRLFKLLGRAELRADGITQERVVDTITAISATLQALASRSLEGGTRGPTRS